MKSTNHKEQRHFDIEGFINKNRIALGTLFIVSTQMACTTSDIFKVIGITIGVIVAGGLIIFYNDPSQKVKRERKADQKFSIRTEENRYIQDKQKMATIAGVNAALKPVLNDYNVLLSALKLPETIASEVKKEGLTIADLENVAKGNPKLANEILGWARKLESHVANARQFADQRSPRHAEKEIVEARNALNKIMGFAKKGRLG